MTEKSRTRDYMDKKLRLLYVQTAINGGKLLCFILLLAWLYYVKK